MIADISPAIGGAPDATAIPSESGSEVSDTIRPGHQVVAPVLQPGQPIARLRVGDDCSRDILTHKSITPGASHRSAPGRGNELGVGLDECGRRGAAAGNARPHSAMKTRNGLALDRVGRESRGLA